MAHLQQKQSFRIFSTPLFGAGWLLVVSGLCAWMTAGLRPEPLSAAPPATEVTLRGDVEAAGFEVVDTARARRIAETGSHLILDARPREQFAGGHLPGAVSLPIVDFEQTLPEVLPLLSSGLPLMVYCTGPRCDEALRLAIRLEEAGFPGAAVYVDGMMGWGE